MTAQDPGKVPVWHAEFPDYPLEDMPTIPAGFEDTSWHNDAGPNFWHPTLRLQLFVDYKDPQQREHGPDGLRFSLATTDDEQGYGDEILVTDEWEMVRAVLMGERFAADCKKAFTPAELRAIRERNASPEYKDSRVSVCATHDFADANMIMVEAFEWITGKDCPDGNDERDCALWDDAWTWAKNRHLTAKPDEFFTEEMVADFANRLEQFPEFQGEDLAEAYFAWVRDPALLYDDERSELTDAICREQGLLLDDEDKEDAGDKDGLRLMRRHAVAEAALCLLIQREAEGNRKLIAEDVAKNLKGAN